jgi:hypothetical protein
VEGAEARPAKMPPESSSTTITPAVPAAVSTIRAVPAQVIDLGLRTLSGRSMYATA